MSDDSQRTEKQTGNTNSLDAAIAAVRGALNARMKDYIALMGSEEKVKRLVAVALKAVATNPDLLSCDRQSLFNAVRSCAEIGLEPNALGHAYFVPFKGKVQFLIGYRGMIELASRSGIGVDAHVVREADVFECEHGLEEVLRHKPALVKRGKTIAAYAVARLPNGQKHFQVLTLEDIEHRRSRNRMKADGGPWSTDFDAMARKTAVRALFSLLPSSDAMEKAATLDADSETYTGPDADSLPTGDTAARQLPPANSGGGALREALARDAETAGAEVVATVGQG